MLDNSCQVNSVCKLRAVDVDLKDILINSFLAKSQMVLDQLCTFTSIQWPVIADAVLLDAKLAQFKQESIQCLHHTAPLRICLVKLLHITLAQHPYDNVRLSNQMNQ